MTDFQKHILGMLEWLHNYIVDHNLTYYVCDGTMLGAARHKGFIPWDDDIDIMMPRDDYERLCSLLEKPVGNYIIETLHSGNDDYLYTSAKLYDISTTMTELLRKKVTRGVYIDIFPLDGLGNSLKEALRTYKRIDRRNMFLMTRTCAIRKNRKWYKNLAIIISRMVPSCFVNEKKMAIKIDKMNKEKSFSNCSYVGMNMSTYRTKDIHKKAILGKPTLYDFERIKVYGPEKYDEYLTEIYGDWRKLPPIEKRQTAHDFVDLNLNKPYCEKKAS